MTRRDGHWRFIKEAPGVQRRRYHYCQTVALGSSVFFNALIVQRPSQGPLANARRRYSPGRKVALRPSRPGTAHEKAPHDGGAW